MSNTVDERVVEMRFDNRNFEQNVQTSMNTLSRLKQSLNLKGASQGLENIDRAARSVNIPVLGDAVETVKAKFSALEVMAVTALANITNSAVNAGKRLVMAFTIDPIKTGLQEYETQINSVQTILSNTRSQGTNLEQVNGALDELNTYADKTIYNFTEMTRNIGTFTAAGVDLDTSVAAIKGIANLAAVSGSTSQQASTAMYQLSQALSSGTVKLQDWNSVVNAGMGGKVFQDALVETAKVHGIKIDEMIKKEGSFRETLSKGWLSSEILTETLKKFTGDLTEEQIKAMGYTEEQAKAIMALGEDANNAATKVKTFTQLMDTLKEAAQSGWAQTWKILIGDFEQAKTLWTDVSDYFSEAIAKSAEARNNLLKAWADSGGRRMALESIKNTFDGILSVLKPIKEAFRDIFPPLTARQLMKATIAIKNFTEKLKLSSEQSDKVKAAFKGLFSVIKMVGSFIGKVAGGIIKLIPNLSGLGNGILTAAAGFGNFLTKMYESVKASDFFGKAIDGVVNFIQKGIDKIKEFGSALKAKFDSPGLVSLQGVFQGVWDMIVKIGSKIGSFASSIGNAFKNAFKNGDLTNILNIFNTGALATILLGIRKFVNGLGDGLGNVTDILDGVKGCLESYQDSIKAETIKKIAVAIAILAGSLLVLSLIDPERLSSALVAVTGLFADLVATMKIMDKFDIGGASKSITNMIKLSAAVLILSFALATLGSLSWDELAVGITGVTVLLGEVIAAAKIMDGESSTITKFAGQMIGMSIAIGALALVAKLLATMSWDELARAGAGITGIVIVLVSAAKIMDSESSAITKFAGQMIGMSIAIGAMAGVAKLLATMSWDELARAGAGITGIVTVLVAAAKIMDSESSAITKFAGQLLVMSMAIGVLAGIAKLLATMSWDELGRAGAGLVGIVVILVSAAKIMDGKDAAITKFAGQLFVMSMAIGILAGIAKLLATMSWDELARAGVGLVGIVTMLVVAAKLLTTDGASFVQGAGQMLIMAVAIGVLAGAMKLISTMSWGDIAKGLVAIAGAFVILGIAGAVLGPLTPAILALSAAIALFGLGCVAVGAGIMMLGLGLTAVAAAGTAAAAALVASIMIILNGLGGMIVAFCNAIADSAVAIGEAVKAVILTLVDVMVECVPALVEGLLVTITALLASLAEHAPEIADSLITLLLGIIDTLSGRMDEIIESLKNFVISVLEGLSTALPEIIAAAVELVGSVIQAIADALGPIIEQVVVPLAETLGDAIGTIAEGLAPIVDSVCQAIQSIVEAIVSIVEQISPIIDSITALVQQLGDSISQIFQSISDTITAAGDTISQVLTSISEVISTCGETIATVFSGIAETIDSVFSGISEVITSVGESIKSVLDGIAGVIESIGNAALNAGTGFENLANGVKTITELNLIDVATSMAAVAKGLKDISSNSEGLAAAGTGMQQIADGATISSNAFNVMANGLSKATSLINSLGPAAASAATSMASAATAGSTAFTASFRSMISSTLSALSSSIGQFRASGTRLIAAFSSGISAGKSTAKSALSSVVSSCKSSMSSYVGVFSGLGRNLVQGFAQGITANTFIAEAAAKLMASRAYIAAKNQLDVNSPSKVFRSLGYSVPEGFAQGIDRLSGIVTKSSVKMANSAIDSVSSAISQVGDSVSMDVAPTIRPVLDLNNAKKASLNLTGNIDNVMTKPVYSLSQVISSSNDALRASNDEVVSAVKGLRDDLQAIYSSDDKEIALYVDSKKLATSIAKPMNRQLNILSKRGAYGI